jgi:ribonuclease HI
MDKCTIYFDGCCEPRNPGGIMGCGWIILLPGVDPCEGCTGRGMDRRNTNNLAEWWALGFALRDFLRAIEDGRECRELLIRGDSMLVVNQLIGGWRTKAPELVRCRERCRELIERAQVTWRAEWVPRKQNAAADALTRIACDRIRLQEKGS